MIELLITILAILLALWWLPQLLKQRKLPPTPPGPRGLPILGSLLSLDPKNPCKSFTSLSNQYATKGIFSLKMGSIYMVVLTDPKLIKETFSKDVFTGRPLLYLTSGIMNGQGIIFSEGDIWRDQRKLTGSWMRILGAARGTLARPKMSERLNESADLIEKKIWENLDSVDIHYILSDVLGNSINELTYGVSFPDEHPFWKWLLRIQEEGVECMGVSAVLNFLPFMRYFSSSLRKSMDVIINGQQQTHNFIDVLIKIRKNRLANIEGIKLDEEDFIDMEKGIEFKYFSIHSDKIPESVCVKPSILRIIDDDCILDFFIKEQIRRKAAGEEEGLERLSDTQLRFFLCDIFGAGNETTLNSLVWFLLLMALHPEEQLAVREELHTVYGSHPPTLDHMNTCIYTRAALCESLRLKTTVPLGVPHAANVNTMIDDFHIPRGTMVIPFLSHIHLDPEAWENPDEYKPSRFIGPDATLLSPPHFIPFQSGKRMCIGDEFARMMLFIYGSRIISQYEISLTEPIDNIEGTIGLTLIPPQYRLKMKPIFK